MKDLPPCLAMRKCLIKKSSSFSLSLNPKDICIKEEDLFTLIDLRFGLFGNTLLELSFSSLTLFGL